MNLFFFGTLMDEDVRTIVCGHPQPVVPASLAGYRRPHVAGRHYPMLVRRPGARVLGVVAEGVDAETTRRLQLYEGWEYTLAPFPLTTADGPLTAHAFVCPTSIAAAEPEWRLDRWRMRHKRLFLPELTRQMARALDADGLKSRRASGHRWPGA